VEVAVEQVGACLQGEPMGSIQAGRFAVRFGLGNSSSCPGLSLNPAFANKVETTGRSPSFLPLLEGQVQVDATAVATGDGDGFDQT
jgi:hypothetical protein